MCRILFTKFTCVLDILLCSDLLTLSSLVDLFGGISGFKAYIVGVAGDLGVNVFENYHL